MSRSTSSEVSEPEKKKKEGNRGKRNQKHLALPPALQQLFDSAVKEAAGKPLSMAPGSPLGRMIGAFVEHCLAEEMNEHLGYQPHERLEPEDTEAPTRRANTRNGYSAKKLKTSMGSTEIDVPRDRLGAFTPQILGKHESMSAEIESRVISMYAHGMSTRDIAEHIRELYHFEASENFVSRLTEQLDPELTQWRNRPLEECYAIIYIDALHLKIRHANGVASTAVYLISGYGEAGVHEILGIWIAPSAHSDGHGESASYWHTIFVELHKRGLKQVLIACSDGLNGLLEALEAVYPQAVHLRCVVHLMRSSLAQVGSKQRTAVSDDLKKIYRAPSYQAAEQALEAFADRYKQQHAGIIQQWREALPTLADLWRYSEGLRKMVYTTNPQENINRQVRKVTKARASMPSTDSALRLLTLVVREIDRRASVSARSRGDWPRIVTELHIHFANTLPPNWGHR
jgi:transposase-like protein